MNLKEKLAGVLGVSEDLILMRVEALMRQSEEDEKLLRAARDEIVAMDATAEQQERRNAAIREAHKTFVTDMCTLAGAAETPFVIHQRILNGVDKVTAVLERLNREAEAS